jgi:cytochrome c oxidase subunit II
MPRLQRWTITALGITLLLAACGGPFPQTTLAPRSDFAVQLDDLFRTIFWWAVGVFVLVEGLLVVAIIRFRAKPGAPAPKRVQGHTLLELTWTGLPALILIFIAVPTIQTIFRTAGHAPEGALRVDVIGHQWWWEYRYPDLGVVTANEMHLPAGRPVALTLTSKDVIHSFWAPGLGGKRDALPGRVNRLAFTSDSVGVYLGQCAEFCGTSHANMRLRVVVESGQAFDAWATAQRTPMTSPVPRSAAETGARVYARSPCIACHTMGGMSQGIIGPDLTHFATRETFASGMYPATDSLLGAWIRNAPAMKPGSLMPAMPTLSDEDVAALVAFLKGAR